MMQLRRDKRCTDTKSAKIRHTGGKHGKIPSLLLSQTILIQSVSLSSHLHSDYIILVTFSVLPTSIFIHEPLLSLSHSFLI